MPVDVAKAAMIGSIMVAVAVLEVISVRKLIEATIASMIKKSGMLLKSIICLPIHVDNPDVSNPVAIDNPPPKSNRMPQGIFLPISQVSNVSLFALEELGIINKAMAPIIAIMLSSSAGNILLSKKVLVVQQHAIKINTAPILFSSLEILPRAFSSACIVSSTEP